MRQWIEQRRVLGAFSDPAGAKAVLAFLWQHRGAAAAVTAVTDRRYAFCADFGIPVRDVAERSAEAWIQDIEVLITGTSLPPALELELIAVAAGRGIETISFVDHWTNFRARFERDGRTVLPDMIAVVDERAHALAIADGLPEERIVVTGNPHHDFLRAWAPSVPRDVLVGSLGLAPARPYILYAPEPLSRFGLKATYGFDEIDGWHALRDARDRLAAPRPAVVIKAHANQDHVPFEQEMAARPDPEVVYRREGDLATLSRYAAAVVGFFSNSLLEARVLGRPVVRCLIGLRAGATDWLAPFEAADFRSVHAVDEFAAVLDGMLRAQTMQESTR